MRHDHEHMVSISGVRRGGNGIAAALCEEDEYGRRKEQAQLYDVEYVRFTEVGASMTLAFVPPFDGTQTV